MNYIFYEILCYDILKQSSDSFENMNLYSIVYEVFQTDKLKSSEDENSGVGQSYLRQVNFYLRIYEKCISHLSLTSPSSVASSLNLIFRQLENQDNDSCFSLNVNSDEQRVPSFVEHQIVDRLYHCALLSLSTEITSTLFHEIEQIAKHLIDKRCSLEIISNSIIRHQRLIEDSEMKYDICLHLLTLLSNILSYEVKNNYSEYRDGKEFEKLVEISNLIRCMIIPIVNSCNKVIRNNENQSASIKISSSELSQFNSDLTKVMRDIWGYLMIYRGLSDTLISLDTMLNPFEFYSTELMSLAYFVTPPLIINSSEEQTNSLLDPEFPPEIIGCLKEILVKYLSKAYPKHSKVFYNLSEDLVVLIGQIDFVLGLQLVYIKNIAVYLSTENIPMPHLVEDIFYYLSHPDIIPQKDVCDILITLSEFFIKEYLDIILHKELCSSFIRDAAASTFSSFILNVCDNCDYVNRIINRYPYLLLWKPCLMSFVTVIDQLAHLMYLEYGKIPEVQLSVRSRICKSSNKPAFEDLITRLKSLCYTAMICDFHSFEILVSTTLSENSNDKLFSVPLESKVHNFTISTIMKWITEYFQEENEYKNKIEFVLGVGSQIPSQLPFPVFNVAKTVKNPIPILDFEILNIKPFMKKINYFIDLTKNMLAFHSNKARQSQDLRSISTEENKEGSAIDLSNVNITELINQISTRIRDSIGTRNDSEAYSNFMTLQSLYIILRNSESTLQSTNSLQRELANIICIIASTDITGILLFGFNQFVKYLIISNMLSDTSLFTKIFFGSSALDKLPESNNIKNIPNVQRVHNDFIYRQDKQNAKLASIINESAHAHLSADLKQHTIRSIESEQLISSVEIIKQVDTHEYFLKNELPTTSNEVCNYFETFIRFVKTCDISNVVFNKRIDLISLIKTITTISSCDISRLIGINPSEDSKDYSNLKLIQIYSVLTEFVFEALLLISEFYLRGINSLIVAHSKSEGNQVDDVKLALNYCVASLSKFIMQIWLCTESIKYYERTDQLQKMIRLLKAIQYLYQDINIFPRLLSTEEEEAIGLLEMSSKRVSRQQLLQPYSHHLIFEVAENRQNVISIRDGINSIGKLYIFNQSDEFFNEKYDYMQDAIFVMKSWIDQLQAHNYDENCPKNFVICPLASKNAMIYYFPRCALSIYTYSPSKGPSTYESSYKALAKECVKAVLANPQKYLLFNHAMLIYTDLDTTEQEPTSREYRNNLHLWRNSDLIVGMRFLNRDYDYYSTLHMNSLQCLNYTSRDSLLFLSSELLQALRTYTDDKVEEFLVNISTKWPSLTHAVAWMAEVETKVTNDKKGRKVPLDRPDTLPDTCKRIIQKIHGKVRKHEKLFFEAESNFFESIMFISSILKPKMPKDEKRRIIKENLVRLNKNIPKGIYLPTNPKCIVESIVETSGAPMQSAAKCPILVAFRVKEESKAIESNDENNGNSTNNIKAQHQDVSRGNNILNESGSSINSNLSENDDLDDRIFASHKGAMKNTFRNSISTRKTVNTPSEFKTPFNFMMEYKRNRAQTNFNNTRMRTSMQDKSMFTSLIKHENKEQTKANEEAKENGQVVACIFKVFDDVRQDILALQLIKLFKDIFKVYELDIHLIPYNVLCNRTGVDRDLGGIIECIPNCHSRDDLGKDYDVNMYQYYIERFGSEESAKFQRALQNFIRSLAGYSIFSYIVQTKDRHNGNIMIDGEGNLIHIDFGFIFDWSPGGDMRFESADFKLTKEMIQILGGNKKTPAYQLFVKRTIQGFLAVRHYAHQIIDLVYFMFHSGLPCFKTKSMKLLRKRFCLELTECEAANAMRKIIDNAHNKWTTKVYDQVQYIQNKIAY